MLIVFLLILSLGGGVAGTYFVMDSHRRRYKQNLLELERTRENLRTELARARDIRERNEAVKLKLAERTKLFETQSLEFTKLRQDFDSRLISYDNLKAECAVLKTDLRNIVIHLDFLSNQRETTSGENQAFTSQRDQLGLELFEECFRNAKRMITTSNYTTQKQRVERMAMTVRGVGVPLTPEFEASKLMEMHKQFEQAVKAAIDREEQARIRGEMREEERRQRLAQQAIEQAEREKAAIQEALLKKQAEINVSQGQQLAQHEAEMDKLRLELAEANARSDRAKSNAELGIRLGHVYVISNIGSFGTGVYKIGLTRRDVPEDRVDELGDASVPFPFDIHMMIRSEDAPKLEKALHKEFHRKRMNRINFRKEFFRVDLNDVVKAVTKHYGEVDYFFEPEAEEYRNGMNVTDAQFAEIEEVYEEAISDEPPIAQVLLEE